MAEHDGRAHLAGGKQHVDLRGAVDHVEIRHHVAASVHDDTGAYAALLREVAGLVALRRLIGEHGHDRRQHAVDGVLEPLLRGRSGHRRRCGRGRDHCRRGRAAVVDDRDDEATGDATGDADRQRCREHG